MAPLRLFPRLSKLGVDAMLARAGQQGQWTADHMKYAEGFTTYGGSGASRVSQSELMEIRDAIVQIAVNAGFPSSQRQSARSAFDAACTAWLGNNRPITSGEALRDDVWAYVAACLLSDVTRWRYGDVPERYYGGVRNTFQRLWLRSSALDRGSDHSDRWKIVSELSEDAFVQITERPSVSADPHLARAIGEAWLETAAEIGKDNMQEVTRTAVRDIRIANEVIYIGALSGNGIRDAVRRYFNAAVRRHLRQ